MAAEAARMSNMRLGIPPTGRWPAEVDLRLTDPSTRLAAYLIIDCSMLKTGWDFDAAMQRDINRVWREREQVTPSPRRDFCEKLVIIFCKRPLQTMIV